ncbi:MAG: hypothetical protein H6671_13600 [Anaerolineaceae bacterium]|nr:hypothetical protein [Anaerolineaceae bacterium]
MEPPSKIPEILNEIFGDDAEKALDTLIEVKDIVLHNNAVDNSVRINPPDKARLTVDDVALTAIAELYKSNFNFYKRVNDDAHVKQFVLDWVFEEVLREKSG